MSNELKIFKNEEFGEVRTLMINNEPYFVGKDVAKILGYSNPRKALIDHVDEEGKTKHSITDNLGRTQESWIINESGVCSLISKSQTKSKEYKLKFKNLLSSLNLIQDKFVINSRKEINFIDKLEESLKPFNIVGEKQYKIFNYRIDYYISSLNIAIEYDENDHKTYTYSKQEGRQKEIENELNCKFIRISDKNSDEYNIGFVIKNILN